ncbi:uncharacterized protein VTP21DRAFT_4473 [Calcarisporiella thermophila]|uniref:uncharacterized protein n=1 Tax=Calcarisporiella thermophila TaxID=911321 RepID=UPI0037437D2D
MPPSPVRVSNNSMRQRLNLSQPSATVNGNNSPCHEFPSPRVSSFEEGLKPTAVRWWLLAVVCGLMFAWMLFTGHKHNGWSGFGIRNRDSVLLSQWWEQLAGTSKYASDKILPEESLDEDTLSFEVHAPPPHHSDHCDVPHPGFPLYQYALMIDAGSTGSRIHVYRFKYCNSSPELEDEVFEQVMPGLSAYAQDPDSGAKSLDTLMQVALDSVPPDLYSCTPVAVKATAGLRLLGAETSEKILEAVRRRLKYYPFPFTEDNVSIMDGRDEGLNAWITVNYLLGNFKTGEERRPTAAVFDLGGGSTQIVFEPDSGYEDEIAEGSHRVLLEVSGHHYVLYQHSYLGHGLMEARKQMQRYLVDQWASNPDAKGDKISNPCLARGHVQSFSLTAPVRGYKTVRLVGAGPDGEACRRIAEKIMDKEAYCPLAPCSFAGVYQPPLAETFRHHDIYTFAYFYDRTTALGMPKRFPLRDLHRVTRQVCSGEWHAFSTKARRELASMPEYCMDLSFIYSLLSHGYGIPEDRELHVAKSIRGAETGWCLGAAIALLDEQQWCKATSSPRRNTLSS